MPHSLFQTINVVLYRYDLVANVATFSHYSPIYDTRNRLTILLFSYSHFLDFLYLVWLSRYKSTIESNFPINGERLVAVEHAMFMFDDLKVTSRDDRMTDRMTTKVHSSRRPP